MGHRGSDLGILPAACLSLVLGVFVETSHVHFIPFYVREAAFIDEELADAVELLVVVPKFGSALYSVLLLCVNHLW
jgi:ABC-type glycerol-3-phosphate transport system permease component